MPFALPQARVKTTEAFLSLQHWLPEGESIANLDHVSVPRGSGFLGEGRIDAVLTC